MKPGNLKGALLEYLIRRLLVRCGFTPIKPDGHYIYDRGHLCFINGKGAAHDADVLVAPPVQMPFAYPSRLLFECKAYTGEVGLPIVRNGLGLRHDINDFEIVTDDSLRARKRNRRASYAIADRARYFYQVGVACVGQFSKPAVEFAANNKIPLFSLRSHLPANVCDLFDQIDVGYMGRIPDPTAKAIVELLKDKRVGGAEMAEHAVATDFLRTDQVAGQIIREFEGVVGRVLIGLLETGDLIFLFAEADVDEHFFRNIGFDQLRAELTYVPAEIDTWIFRLTNPQFFENGRTRTFRFQLPGHIVSQWSETGRDRAVATNLKEEYFSRLFLFQQRNNNLAFPFFMVRLDEGQLQRIRELFPREN